MIIDRFPLCRSPKIWQPRYCMHFMHIPFMDVFHSGFYHHFLYTILVFHQIFHINQVFIFNCIFHILSSCHVPHILQTCVASLVTTRFKGMYTICILNLVRSKALITCCILNLYGSNIYTFYIANVTYTDLTPLFWMC